MPPVSGRARQWRSLVENPELAGREFPSLGPLLAEPETRRRVLKLMAASVALAGLGGCDPSEPDGHWVPAVVAPPEIVPGLPNYYSTASTACGYASGIVVAHQMGRPIKVEGNSAHPASLGATDIHAQALILDFYDPDRACGVMRSAEPASWQDVLGALAGERARLTDKRGAGLRILTGTVLSPTLAATLDGVLRRYPEARWHQWEPVSRDNARAGLALAYGRPVALLPHVEAADVILALDSDLISAAPGHLRHARGYASRRNPTRARMSRVYAAEATPTLVGAAADHRFAAGPAEMHAVVRALAASVLQGETPQDAPSWVAHAAADLKGAGGRALVHAGPALPPEAHALIHAVNEKLGARGTTFDLIDPVEHRPEDQAGSLRSLIDDMEAGRVETLLILGGNPVYAAPGFAEALGRVKFSLSLAPSPDETAWAAGWYVPETHPFEAWGDALAYDGTATIMQPQALPLYGGHSAVEMLALFADPFPVTPLDAVKQAWQPQLGDESAWREALANGVVPNTAHGKADVTLRAEAAGLSPPAPPARPLTLLLQPDPNLWDGRHANNPWLQELPRPLSKLVWDNPLLVAPGYARREGLVNGAEVTLSLAGQSLRAPVWIVPGQAEDCVVGWLGGGRTRAGTVGNGVGYDYTRFRGLDGTPALAKTGRQVPVACTDHHNPLEVGPGDIVRHGTLADFARDAHFLQGETNQPSIYHRRQTTGVAWGMSVDLNACIGCNACVIACQAENNVPVVGKEEVLRQREMHWLRIDRYYEGDAASPESFFQPMLCMHCEEAPCEPVCPVAASVHDSEGLNLQVYNRCVGTRFCSNNCPYKVRRFNFDAYARKEHRPDIARNPDVTARARGVMEKCTFCVQRIAEARIAHDRDGAPERTETACQAACPTRAFTFGDINDPDSEVVARKKSPLDYALLAEQNTHPRLTYEGRITNPNKEAGA